MEIAKYTVGVGFNLKWKQLDVGLKLAEKRLGKFATSRLSLPISKFNIDQKKLNLALTSALNRSTRTTAFSVSNFSIDQAALTRQLTRALRNASRAASAQADVNVGGGGIGARQAGLAGGIGGLAARGYAPLLALGLGGYGLGATNRRNQEVVSAQLQSQAVVQQAGGTVQQGRASFDYLRSEGERIGFNYLEASGDYNKLISGLTGAGVGVEDSQQVFTGFSELARVNKLDATSQNRLFRALSQVAGKNQLMSEELTGQIAEALPGGVALFAEAYQRQLADTGRGAGDKTGNEAIQELRAAIEKGEVKGDVLLYAGRAASGKAQGGLAAASQASQAEQARFQNAYNDLAITASNSGLESGFSRLFRALADGAKESAPLIEGLARGFDSVTKYASALLLTTQSIQRFFQGRDSFLGDKLFPDAESQNKAFLFLEQTKTALGEVNTLIANSVSGWQQLFSLIDSSSVLDRLTQAMRIVSNSAGALNALASGDFSGAAELARGVGTRVVNAATAPGRYGVNLALEGGTRALEALDPRVSSGSVTPPRINAFQVEKTYLDYKTEKEAQRNLAAAQARKAGYPGTTGVLPIDSGSVTATFNIYGATNAEEVGQVVNRHLSTIFNSAKLEVPQGE